MSARTVPYEPCYWGGVKELASKYFHYPNNYDYMLHWTPTIYHSWDDEIVSEFSYPHGMVLLDKNEVVGFFGCIFSYRYTQMRTKYRYLNFSRWILEKGYRHYYFSMIHDLLKEADVISDLSASDAVYESLVNIYKFTMVDSVKYRFFPIPYTGVCSIEIHDNKLEDIENDILRKEYKDHIEYGIKVVCFSNKTEAGYAFYRTRGKGVYIVKVINIPLFSKYLHEIIWEIQKRNFFFSNKVSELGAGLLNSIKKGNPILCECDKRFLGNRDIQHPLYLEKPFRALLLNRLGQELEMDNLYSEYSVTYTSKEYLWKALSNRTEIM